MAFKWILGILPGRKEITDWRGKRGEDQYLRTQHWVLWKNLTMSMPFDPEISILGISPKKRTTSTNTDSHTRILLTLLVVGEIWECLKHQRVEKDGHTPCMYHAGIKITSIKGFIFFLRFYLFIHNRQRERGRDTGRGRSRLHAGSPMWDSIPGLQDHTLGCRWR